MFSNKLIWEGNLLIRNFFIIFPFCNIIYKVCLFQVFMEHLKKLSVSSQAWTIQPPGSQSVTSSSRSVTSWSSRSLRRKPRILNADQYICDKLYRLKCRIVVLLNFMNLNISVRKLFIYCRIFLSSPVSFMRRISEKRCQNRSPKVYFQVIFIFCDLQDSPEFTD